MPKVTFLPMNRSFEGSPGESILDIAINNDVPIEHACGGFCACTTCHVHVLSGDQQLTAQEEDEIERIGGVNEQTHCSRLACQAKVQNGDVTVKIINLDV